MRPLTPILLTLALAACSTEDPAAPTPDSHLDTQPEAGAGFITVVDAGNRESQETVYFSFEGGEERYPDSPGQSEEWDLSFRFAWIRINGGVSGPGGMELLPLDYEDYGALEIAPAGEYISDTDLELAFDSGQGWYIYIQGTDDWFMAERVYAIRAVSGLYYKLKVINFLDDQQLPGRLEFRWQEIQAPR